MSLTNAEPPVSREMAGKIILGLTAYVALGTVFSVIVAIAIIAIAGFFGIDLADLIHHVPLPGPMPLPLF